MKTKAETTTHSPRWLPNIGPYTFVSRDRLTTKTLDGERRTFRIVVYGAYNAMGLIGSECNGVAILDEDRKQVLCDEIEITGTGYCGPSAEQLTKYGELYRMTGARFRAFVNSHKRSRYSI